MFTVVVFSLPRCSLIWRRCATHWLLQCALTISHRRLLNDTTNRRLRFGKLMFMLFSNVSCHRNIYKLVFALQCYASIIYAAAVVLCTCVISKDVKFNFFQNRSFSDKHWSETRCWIWSGSALMTLAFSLLSAEGNTGQPRLSKLVNVLRHCPLPCFWEAFLALCSWITNGRDALAASNSTVPVHYLQGCQIHVKIPAQRSPKTSPKVAELNLANLGGEIAKLATLVTRCHYINGIWCTLACWPCMS